jgi:hypothetical protein
MQVQAHLHKLSPHGEPLAFFDASVDLHLGVSSLMSVFSDRRPRHVLRLLDSGAWREKHGGRLNRSTTSLAHIYVD